MEDFLNDPKGFFLAMLAFALVAFVSALGRGEKILHAIVVGMITFVICGSTGAILIYQLNLHPFVACGIVGLISTITHKVLPAMERLVLVVEEEAASWIRDYHVARAEKHATKAKYHDKKAKKIVPKSEKIVPPAKTEDPALVVGSGMDDELEAANPEVDEK